MANESAGGQYGGYLSTAGFLGGILEGVSSLFKAPAFDARPQRPAQSQILIGRNAGFVSDPSSPATATHPAGYALADQWFNPYDPVTVEKRAIVEYQRVPDPNGGPPRAVPVTTGYDTTTTPKFYFTKAAVQEDQVAPPPAGVSEIFRSPESATINTSLCDPSTSQAAATVWDRLNRLTNNQFFSPFRARRAGGNSYQALSEADDQIFRDDGRPGDFSPEVMPAFIRRGRKERIFRG
jgi:hypothetical protein